MSKLTISIDMGAKNNGVFVAKTKDNEIVDKKAFNVFIDGKKINFSKKSRRENRHRVRNIQRRKLAKRLLWDLLQKDTFSKKEQEKLQGILNNRGFTYMDDERFTQFGSNTMEIFDDLKEFENKDKFNTKLESFDDEHKLLDFLNKLIQTTDKKIALKKQDYANEFEEDFIDIKDELKAFKSFLETIIQALQTGAKPRETYLKEIKQQIDKFDFIEDKKHFYNLIGNISNFQLRFLRKYFNQNSTNNKYKLIKNYFQRFHYKTDKEKHNKKAIFEHLCEYDSFESFLKNTPPNITITPFEDMNNRDTYKCNSMLISETSISKEITNFLNKLRENDNFANLLIDTNGEIQKDISNPKLLQRFLDASKDVFSLYPRAVFKFLKPQEIDSFKDVFSKDDFIALKDFAQQYYKDEGKLMVGLQAKLLKKCNLNTPYKNNIKERLLKPLYDYAFTRENADKFIVEIKNQKLVSFLERIDKSAKVYQNSFYNVCNNCLDGQKCVDDKEIKYITKNLDKNLQKLQTALKQSGIENSCIQEISTININNLNRILNILKQTYDILFKNIHGFNKTCKECTIENNLRSDEQHSFAKRLISDVAKPIDGMLDFMLDNIAFNIVKQIDNLNDINEVEILIEQNRFEFEENLNDIKGKKNKKKEIKHQDSLEVNICPYAENGTILPKEIMTIFYLKAKLFTIQKLI